MANSAPIYTQIFVQCDEKDEGGFFVTGEDYDTYLRPASFDEITPDTLIYVEIRHEVKWPYGKVDFEKPLSEFDKEMGILDKPSQFCQAAIVATPKLTLL